MNGRTGLTLIETLIGTALFGIIATAIYFSFSNILEITTNTKLISSATAAIQSQVEIIRNMPFQDVGVIGGWPVGKLPASTSTVYDGTPFILAFTVRNIDDPFDGTLGGTPNDTAPADYKLIEITASCPKCGRFVPVTVTARVAPKALETASSNGSLFVSILDANALPVSGANVTVVNASTTPTITINDTTNTNGDLQLVDIPTSTSNYQVTVTKSGYSTDRTYPLNDPTNPNPLKLHATVATGQTTQVTFFIDRTSTLIVRTVNDFCVPVLNVSFSWAGAKLIGTSPDVLKFSATSTTGASGTVTFTGVEWDTYAFQNTDAIYDIVAYNLANLTVPIGVSTAVDLQWTVAPKNPSALLVGILDQNGQSIADATTTLTAPGFQAAQKTGRSRLAQTNWSATGTSGFSSQSGGIDTSVLNQISLTRNASGTYNTGVQEWLISNTFDLGTSTTNYHLLSWLPATQPPSVGAGAVQFQVAGNNDDTTWTFVGPDGTGTSYFTTPSSTIVGLAGMRYFRYRVFFMTADENVSPSIIRVEAGFGSGCYPGGYAYFGGLANGDYTLTVERAGFQSTSTTSTVTSGWQQQNVILSP